MMHRIFFCRHAYPGNGDYLDQSGYNDLERVREKLHSRSFIPTGGLTSTEHRCIQTATFLLEPNSACTILSDLHAYGTFAQITTAGAGKWLSARDYAYLLYDRIKEANEQFESLVVCSHDCIAIVLAYAFLEQRGETVDWEDRSQPQQYRFLHTGHGVLLTNNQLEYFSSD